jgi:hypothetical protein
MAHRHEQPHHQFVIATKATGIVVVAAPFFFHLVAAICEILLNEFLSKRTIKSRGLSHSQRPHETESSGFAQKV